MANRCSFLPKVAQNSGLDLAVVSNYYIVFLRLWCTVEWVDASTLLVGEGWGGVLLL